jgi:hypothetical protein
MFEPTSRLNGLNRAQRLNGLNDLNELKYCVDRFEQDCSCDDRAKRLNGFSIEDFLARALQYKRTWGQAIPPFIIWKLLSLDQRCAGPLSALPHGLGSSLS